MLRDLDELILRCRDDMARRHIAEAVAAYKAGAYRACIVMTGISVLYDVIQKIKELAFAGDAEAERQSSYFNELRERNDIKAMLDFERNLLESARDKFQLISHVEFIDLARLVEDRNRCAHPSFKSESDTFQPSAELARVHLTSAVDHLLSHEPAQGKYALDSIMRDIGSKYFPYENDKVYESLAQGPLKRGRASLVRNFLVLISKKYFVQKEEHWKSGLVNRACLAAAEKMHPAVWERFKAEDLPKLARAAIGSGAEWPLVELSFRNAGIWSSLPYDVQEKLRNFVMSLPAGSLPYIDDIWRDCNGLRGAAEIRMSIMTASEITDASMFWIGAPGPVLSSIVKKYCSARSFDDANSWAEVVKGFATNFSADHMKNIAKACRENGQLAHSFSLKSTLQELSKNESAGEAWWKEAIEPFVAAGEGGEASNVPH